MKNLPIQDATIKENAQIEGELKDAKLSNPLSKRFEALICFKQRKDCGLATTAQDVETSCDFHINTVGPYIKKLEQIHMVEKIDKGKYIITEKGEHFLYETILPVFSNQQKIAKKLFFRDNLTHDDLVLQENHKCLENAFSNLKTSSLKWFKMWLATEFGNYMLFEEWFLEFEKQHVKFFQEQLTIEKNDLNNAGEK